MSYRDQTDQLRLQVHDLQEELDGANRKIERLTGVSPAAGGDDRSNWYLGAPTTLTLERTLPLEVSDERYEAVAVLLHDRLDPRGTITQVGRTLTYQDLHRRLTLARRDDGTTVLTAHSKDRDNLFFMSLAWMLAWTFAFLEAVRFLRDDVGGPFWSIGVALPLTALVTWLVVRTAFQWRVHRSRGNATAVFEAVAELASPSRESMPARPRIEASSADAEPREDVDLEAEVEAEAALPLRGPSRKLTQ